MWRTILVDDERYVRAELADLFPWEAFGFALVAEAGDGREALGLIQSLRPHLVITDIRMPEMDGLALTDWVKTNTPEVLVAVVSAYVDFHLVREALRLGAVDYLTKAEATAETAGELLRRIAAMLAGREVVQAQRREESERYHTLAVATFWRDTLTGVLEKDEIETRAMELGLGLNGEYALMVVHAKKAIGRPSEDRSWQDLMGELLADRISGGVWWLIDCHRNDWALILSLPRDQASPDIIPLLIQIAMRLAEQGGGELTISMAMVLRPPSALAQSFYEACEVNAMRLYIGCGRYIGQETLSALEQTAAPNLPDLLGRWERTMRNGNLEDVNEFLEILFSDFMPHCLSPFQGRWLILDLVNILRRIALERGIRWDKLAGGADPVKVLDRAESCEEWRTWLLEIVAAYMPLTQTRSASPVIQVVQKALAYIQANFARDLSLQEVAEQAGVCKSYLSRVFPEHIGENYSDYLQRLRIDRAKELLRLSDARVHEIAGMVGFWNVRYFSRVFRENVGMTPADYRRLPMETEERRY